MIKHAAQMQNVKTILVPIDVPVLMVINKYQIVRFNAKMKESLK